ncbi:hypothetical protein TNCV_1594451 [Trichonephila clavipes]|nr:hypothetical protein TNCV_1594451 [Trichonephila clavipes]
MRIDYQSDPENDCCISSAISTMPHRADARTRLPRVDHNSRYHLRTVAVSENHTHNRAGRYSDCQITGYKERSLRNIRASIHVSEYLVTSQRKYCITPVSVCRSEYRSHLSQCSIDKKHRSNCHRTNDPRCFKRRLTVREDSVRAANMLIS